MPEYLLLLVSVAKEFTLSIQKIPQLDNRRQLAQTNLKVQSNVLATVVERNDRATNLVKAVLQVLLLPHREDVVDVAVVEVEDGFTGAVVRITSLSQCTANAEVTTAVDVGYREGSLALDCTGKASVVLRSHDLVDELLIGPHVDEGRDEVTLQAVRFWEVDHELVGCERSVGDASTTCSTFNTKGVRLGCGVDLDAVTAEAGIWLPDLRVEDACRCGVLRLRIRRPVPVGLAASVAAFFPQSLFVGGDEVAVPKCEVTNPVDVGCLAAVDGLEVVETVDSALDAGDGWLRR